MNQEAVSSVVSASVSAPDSGLIPALTLSRMDWDVEVSVNISLVSVLSQLQKANQDVTSPQLLISSFSHFSLGKAFVPLLIFFIASLMSLL